MAAEGRADISADIAAKFPTNNVKFISALLLRTFEELINDSKFNLVDDDLSDINFSDGDFTATNALDALLEVNSRIINAGAVPLFYVEVDVDVSISSIDNVTLVSTNYSTGAVSVSKLGESFDISFNDTSVTLGYNLGYVVGKTDLNNEAARFTPTIVNNTLAKFWAQDLVGSGVVARHKIYFFVEPSEYLVS